MGCVRVCECVCWWDVLMGCVDGCEWVCGLVVVV